MADSKELRAIVGVDDWGNYQDTLNGVPLRNGEQLVIEWPNGTIESATVVIETTTVPICDHGHDYYATRKVAHVVCHHHGALVMVKICGFRAARVASHDAREQALDKMAQDTQDAGGYPDLEEE